MRAEELECACDEDGCCDCGRDLVGTRVLDSAWDITLTKPALVNRAISNQLLPLCIVAYKAILSLLAYTALHVLYCIE